MDGKYFGSYEISPVLVKVETEIKEGKVQNIMVKDHQNALGKNAKSLSKEMIRQQKIA